MKLLKEMTTLQMTEEQIKESLERNKGKLKMKGIIQRADVKNANGRVYPREILEREIENYRKLVIERRAHGECDHQDSLTVELKNVSHIVTDIYMDDDGAVHGEIEILPTPMGNIIRALVESQVTVGISSRALGSVVSHGDADIVQDDLHFICWDMVSEPSTPGAYMFKEAREIDPRLIKKIFKREDRLNRVANDILAFDRKLRQ